jgi:hypothetical protein
MLGSSEVAINLRSSAGQHQIVHHDNEYLKRRLAQRGVAFEALDNGVNSCANPKLMRRPCDELAAPPAHLAMAIPAWECEAAA